MSSDLDHFAPKDPATTPIEDGSRRHFLAQGGALTGTTLAASALMGLGALVAPCAAAKPVIEININSRSPIWTPLTDALKVSGLKDADKISNIYLRSTRGVVDGIEVNQGVVRASEVNYTRWGRRIERPISRHTFQFRNFVNSISQWDIFPDSFKLYNNQVASGREVPVSRYGEEELRRRLLDVDRGDPYSSLPPLWEAVIALARRLGYGVEKAVAGGLFAGCQRTTWTFTDRMGFVVGVYTIYHAYIQGRWHVAYIPNITGAMNGLINDINAALTTGITAVAGAQVAGWAAIIAAAGRGLAYLAYELDTTNSENPSDLAIATTIASVLAGGAAGLHIYRRWAMLRASSVLSTMFVQVGTVGGIYQTHNEIPMQPWERDIANQP